MSCLIRCEKKIRFEFLGAYEKQMRTLTNENDKLKQQIHQTDRTIAQLKRENEELQQKVNTGTPTIVFAFEICLENV